jgi:hypothetical protein
MTRAGEQVDKRQIVKLKVQIFFNVALIAADDNVKVFVPLQLIICCLFLRGKSHE